MPSPLPDAPRSFRGRWIRGLDAHRRASRISGPFQLEAKAPLVWAEPTDTHDLVALLEWSAQTGTPLVPRGAGTGMPGGNLAPGVVVSLREGFGQIRPAQPATVPASSEPRSGTIRVGAGAVAARVEEAAGVRGLTLPCLPSSAAWCTVGGMVANNAAGARSFGHGAVREWVEAVEGVDADGTPFRCTRDRPGDDSGEGSDKDYSGLMGRLARWRPDLLPGQTGAPEWPRLRKNSSGYALDKVAASDGRPLDLLIGSEGTLALITGLTLRLAPRPPARGVHLLPVSSPDEASALAVEADELGASACEFLGRRFIEIAQLEDHPLVGDMAQDAWALFLLEFEGTDPEVSEGLDLARKAGSRMGDPGIGSRDPEVASAIWELRHGASPLIARAAQHGLVSTQFMEDSVVPPDRLGDYLTGLDRILTDSNFDAVVFGHAGDGNVHVNPLVPTNEADWPQRVRTVLDEVVDLVAGLGGTLAGEHGDGRLRAPFLDRIWGPRWSEAFRRIKSHFDPDGRLNPGVIIPLPGQDPLANLAPRPRSWPV